MINGFTERLAVLERNAVVVTVGGARCASWGSLDTKVILFMSFSRSVDLNLRNIKQNLKKKI